MNRSVDPEARAQFAEYYVWQEPSTDRTTCLNPQMVDRLQINVLTALGSAGPRGLETGGILLGRTETIGTWQVTVVEDFEPVPIEHRLDRSYSLVSRDEEIFRAALARCSSGTGGLSVVGYYRSHNREGLFLSPEDLRFIGAYFPEEDHVFLVIKALSMGACTAGFFFWENGSIQPEFPAFEVPFGPIESPGFIPPQEATALEVRQADPIPTQDQIGERTIETSTVLAFEPKSIEAVRVPLRLSGRSVVTILCAAAMVILVLGLIVMTRRPLPAHPNARIRLNVEQQSQHLTLTWDPTSPQMLASERTLLYIRDGADQRVVSLNPDQVRSGAISYRPAGNNVEFRLEAYRDGKPLSIESLYVVVMKDSGGLLAGSTVPTGKPTRPRQSDNSGSSGARQDVSGVSPAASGTDPGIAIPRPMFQPPQLTQMAKPAGPNLAAEDLPPVSVSDLGASLHAPTPPPVRAAEPPKKQVEEAPVPQAPPVLDQQPGPVVSYVAPEVTRRVSPVVPPAIRSLLASPVDIEVTVAIDAAGAVTNARVTGTKGTAPRLFAPQAVAAAQGFRFRPAMRNNSPVESSMVLTFRFSRSNE